HQFMDCYGLVIRERHEHHPASGSDFLSVKIWRFASQIRMNASHETIDKLPNFDIRLRPSFS
ncbi:MAG: hypothetical protein AAFR68_21880, partial [Pseudomonadota bacterium]